MYSFRSGGGRRHVERRLYYECSFSGEFIQYTWSRTPFISFVSFVFVLALQDKEPIEISLLKQTKRTKLD